MAIEKGRLIDMLNQPAEGFNRKAVEPIPSYFLADKDKKTSFTSERVEPPQAGESARADYAVRSGTCRRAGSNTKPFAEKHSELLLKRYRCLG